MIRRVRWIGMACIVLAYAAVFGGLIAYIYGWIKERENGISETSC